MLYSDLGGLGLRVLVLHASGLLGSLSTLRARVTRLQAAALSVSVCAFGCHGSDVGVVGLCVWELEV